MASAGAPVTAVAVGGSARALSLTPKSLGGFTQGRSHALVRLWPSPVCSRATSSGCSGQPIPWYTYPAIEFIRQLDFSQSTVFEYGSGNSTMFWAASAARVISVEEDA